MARESILLVEDEHDIRELLKFHLERENLAVEAYEKGEDALASLKTHGVSLVLLDLMLPGIDGLEVCRRLKAQPETRDIPSIMLTANCCARLDEGSSSRHTRVASSAWSKFRA